MKTNNNLFWKWEKKPALETGFCIWETKKKKKKQTDGLIPPWLISAGLTAFGSLFGKVKRRKRYGKKEELQK